MSLATVRQALSDAVDGIADVRATPYVPDQINPPQAVVGLREIDYDLVFGRGADIFMFMVQFFVARTAEKQAQILLDTLCEPAGVTSLKTVVEADSGLGALVDYARVRRVTGPQVATIGSLDFLVVEFDVEVCY